jgi:hypothetical protein
VGSNPTLSAIFSIHAALRWGIAPTICRQVLTRTTIHLLELLT